MNSIQQSRLWLIGGAVVTVLILLVGYLLLIAPQLTTAESIRNDVQTELDRNVTLETRISQLKASNEKLDVLQSDLDAARSELPVRNQTEVFAASLRELAEKNIVSVTSISFGGPENVTSVAQGTVETPVVTGTDEPTEEEAATNAEVAATAAADAAAARQTFSIPVTFTVEGVAAAVDTFVNDVQARGQRATAINKVVVNPVAGISGGNIGNDIVASYSGFIYLSPLSPDDAAALFDTQTDG